MAEFEEKRIYLIGLYNDLTATNAMVMDKFKIPKVKELIKENGGHIDLVNYRGRKYYMLFADEGVIEFCMDIMTFVYSQIDVTEQIVSGNYNKIVRCFDVEKFYRKYEAYYLNNCTVEYAKKNIRFMGKNSRYLDYKVLFNHGVKYEPIEEQINSLIIDAMKKRGFIMYEKDCNRIDLHLYFEPNPVQLETLENGFTAIKVSIKIYHANQELFIGYTYKAIITKNGFKERHSFGSEYSYVLKVIRRLIHESGAYDCIMNFK